MKLGVFDSGLGGILIARAIRDAFPDLDMVYLGDTVHLPYGNRSEEAIYKYSKACMEALFAQGCNLVIMACNTASASALRRLQQEYLPVSAYADRRILGVVVSTIEEAIDRGFSKLGLIGTNYTVSSNVYEEELQKINPEIAIEQKNTPLLVPLIEHGGEAWVDSVLAHYLEGFEGVETLLLGCTHYVHLKERIRDKYDFDVISQDEIIPPKLAQYFDNHPEIFDPLGQGGESAFFVTDLAAHNEDAASALYGRSIELKVLEGVHEHD
jgi:glutamate racemase